VGGEKSVGVGETALAGGAMAGFGLAGWRAQPTSANTRIITPDMHWKRGFLSDTIAVIISYPSARKIMQ
jgi:hypothetical protein